MVDGGNNNLVLSALAVDMEWEAVCSNLSRLHSSGNLVKHLEQELKEYHHPLLHIVAERGDKNNMNSALDCIKRAEDLMAVIQHSDNRGRNVLHIAASKCDESLRCILTRLDRDFLMDILSQVCHKSLTALQTAIEHQNLKAVDIILMSTSRPESVGRTLPKHNERLAFISIPSSTHPTALHSSATLGNAPIFESILKYLGPKERLIIAKTAGESGRSLLHCVAEGGNLKVLTTLLSTLPTGQLLEQLVVRSDKDGNSSLHIACKFGCIECFEKLLSCVTPQLQLHLLTQLNNQGKTALNLLDPAGPENELAEKWAFELQILKETTTNPILAKILKCTAYRDRFNTTLSMITMAGKDYMKKSPL